MVRPEEASLGLTPHKAAKEAVGIVRRRADMYGMFALGFGLGFAAYMVSAIAVSLLGDSPSFGEGGS